MSRYIRIFLIFAFILFCYLFTCFYTGKEMSLYACDYVEQNLFYYDFGGYLANHNFKQFFEEMSYGINYWNRNPFLINFLLPFYIIFKNSRAGFIFAVEIVFMLPVMLLTAVFIKDKVLNQKDLFFEAFIYSSVLLCPALWLCSLRGIPDICGMITVLIAWYLYLKDDMSSLKSFKTVLAVSVLLYLAFLMRRWYSVVILCFFVSVFCENIIGSVIQKLDFKEIVKKTGCTLLNLIISGGIIYFLGLIIQTEYVKRIWSAESEERALYSFGQNLIEQFWNVFVYYSGFLYSLFAFIAVILLLKNKKIRFVIINLAVYLFLFFIVMNSQFLWINHNLFPAVCIIILFCAGVYKVLSYVKNIKIKNVILCLFILLNILNFFTFFCIEKPEKLNIIFPSVRGIYQTNENYDKIKNLYLYLENEYQKNNNIKVAQYGLNDNIGYYQLRELSGNSIFVKNNFLSEVVLDSEYYFKELLADYAIVITPVDIYVDESQSRMLHITHDLFINNEGIAKNYVLVNKYELSDGKNILLYKRETPLSVEQMREYAQIFYQYYPDWEYEFNNFLRDNNFVSAD